MLTPHQGFTYNKFQKPNDWPKIEDTFDYKYDNGKLIGGNKNLFLSGPVTYEKVGNPTIVDGIASGFSASNYVEVQTTLPSTDITKYLFRTKVKLPATISDSQRIFGYKTLAGGGNGLVSIFYRSNGKISWNVIRQQTSPETDVSLTSNTTFSQGDIVLIECGYKGSNVFYLKTSTDNGTTWKEVTTTATATLYGINTNAYLAIGRSDSTQSSTNEFNGEIYLNDTYVMVDGSLWFYGKNYTTSNMVPVPKGLEYNNTTAPSNGWVYTNSDLVKGPVNYTVVGNPTIVDGVASRFSSSNYLTCSQQTPTTGEIVYRLKFTTGDSFPGTVLLARNASFGGPVLSGNGDFGVTIHHFNDQSQERNATVYLSGTSNRLAANTTYIGECGLAGGKLFISLYEASGTLIVSENQDFAYNFIGSTQYIGRPSSTGAAFNGSIDLNETYIKINGQYWFGNVSRFQEFIPAPEEAQIGKDDTHNLVVETPTIKGQVDYTIVGNPTIVDGVVSGFSDSNYLTIPTMKNLTMNEIEFVTRILNFNGLGRNNVILRADSTRFVVRYETNGQISFIYKSDDGDETLNTGDVSSVQDIYIKVIAKNNSQELYTCTDGTTWQLAQGATATITSLSSLFTSAVTAIGVRPGVNSQRLGGKMDLNKTYIKIDGQYWFKPKTELLSPKMIGPVEYNIVGSPTIIDGIASGFVTSASYLTLNDTISSWADSFEMQVKFTMPTIAQSGRAFIFANGSGQQGFLKANNNGVSFAFYDTDGNQYYGVSPVLAAGKTYVGKVTYDSSTYTLTVTVKGDVVDFSSSHTFSYPLRDNATTVYQNICIGGNGGTYLDAFNGSVDLNNTYIKVNGKLWFGKQDWTPSTHTDNAIYLLGSHNTDYSTYNTQGINPTIETESDESGTYNVWIDNQEIYKEQSNPLDINWNNLALTTGYNITTPSTLKAHIIKVEPNNGNITRFSTDTNYKVENGLLTWASPKLYLEGPTQYEVVGTPTITDGIISGFSSSNYLNLGNVQNVFENNFEVTFCFTTNTEAISSQGTIFKIGFYFYLYKTTDGRYIQIRTYDSNNSSHYYTPVDTQDAWYSQGPIWIKIKYMSDGVEVYRSKDGNNYELHSTWSGITRDMSDQTECVIGRSPFDGSIDLNKTYIKVNNELWFGKIYTSETDVPVPANFTYGNTTTSSNGTVNLTTQEFSADTLATYGKDS